MYHLKKILIVPLTWSLWLPFTVGAGKDYFHFAQKEPRAKEMMSPIHDSRKSWYAAFQFPCSCVAPHFREWKAQRSHQQILIEHLLCFRYQGAKVNQVSAVLAFNLSKECWDQKGVALSFSAGPFLNLDGMISWFPIILEPYLPYLYNGRSRIYPAFSLGLSSGPNESARGGKKKKKICDVYVNRLTFLMQKYTNSRQTTLTQDR